MAYQILMPRLGWNMEEGTLVEWLKQDGERVQTGDLVCVIEGDKATNEVESFESGVLRIPPSAPSPGTTVPVGTLLGFVVPDAELATFDFSVAPPPVSVVEASVETAQTSSPSTPSGRGRRNGPTISPRARRAAAALDVDWQKVAGSGLTGRIVERDIQAAAARRTTTAEAIPMGGMRKAISDHLTAAVRTVAPVTLTTETDATRLSGLRERLKQTLTPAPAYHDLIVMAVAQALIEHPALNASLRDDRIVRHGVVNIGLAVDTEHGLVAPAVRDVAGKTLAELTQATARLVEDAHEGRLSHEQLQDGTFTVTNLGMYEIDFFTPIINLPQCAILGVGRIVPKVVVIDEATATTGIRRMMTLSLTFDHRIVDGAPAARFLQAVKRRIENPESLVG